jgi:molybdate transport system regulatory protein
MADIRLTVRVDFGSDRVLGPGKIRLLEEIGRSGSISQAGRSLKMSYRRAWLLVDDMNRCFRSPVVTTQPGGAHGGGAALTALGRELIKEYRSIVSRAMAATEPQLRGLEGSLRPRATRGRRLSKEPGRAAKASR